MLSEIADGRHLVMMPHLETQHLYLELGALPTAGMMMEVTPWLEKLL
jgi:hypothetical protein